MNLILGCNSSSQKGAQSIAAKSDPAGTEQSQIASAGNVNQSQTGTSACASLLQYPSNQGFGDFRYGFNTHDVNGTHGYEGDLLVTIADPQNASNSIYCLATGGDTAHWEEVNTNDLSRLGFYNSNSVTPHAVQNEICNAYFTEGGQWLMSAEYGFGNLLNHSGARSVQVLVWGESVVSQIYFNSPIGYVDFSAYPPGHSFYDSHGNLLGGSDFQAGYITCNIPLKGRGLISPELSK